MRSNLQILMITSGWPRPDDPYGGLFVALQVRMLRSLGADVEVFAFRGALNPVRYLRAWLAVQRKLRQQQYDVLHAHYGQSGLLTLGRNRPLVLTFHGSDLQGIVGKHGRYTLTGEALRRLGQWIGRAAEEIIVVSADMTRFFPKREVHVLPVGVNFDLFVPMSQTDARRSLGLPSDRCLVLFAADPNVPAKRYHLAQQVMARLPIDRQVTTDLLVTAGVSHEKMPVYMNACDALLLTSHHEGSPSVVKEALACNLPVVAVNVGDVRERIAGVDGCALCADDRPETIAAALEGVLARRQRLQGGRDAIRPFDERLLAQRVLAIYRSAMQKHQRRPARKAASMLRRRHHENTFL